MNLKWTVDAAVVGAHASATRLTIDGTDFHSTHTYIPCRSEDDSQTLQVEVEGHGPRPLLIVWVGRIALVRDLRDAGPLMEAGPQTLSPENEVRSQRRTVPLRFEGRPMARVTADGRVELCFALREGPCHTSAARFVPVSSVPHSRWMRSGEVGADLGEGRVVLGRITVRRLAGADYLEVCFTPADGERICSPPNNFTWGRARLGR